METHVYPARAQWLDPTASLCSTYSDTSRACVAEKHASQCQALVAEGCMEIFEAESCPVQLSCARSVCPAIEPAPNAACWVNGLSCTLQTYTCPGTLTPITTKSARCHNSTWLVMMASIHCPEPEPEPEPAAIAGGVIGGCVVVLMIAILAYATRRTRQKTPAATPDIKTTAGSRA